MLNKDFKKRNKILGLSPIDNGDILKFTGLNKDNFKKLVEENFIDLDDCQNNNWEIVYYKSRNHIALKTIRAKTAERAIKKARIKHIIDIKKID